MSTATAPATWTTDTSVGFVDPAATQFACRCDAGGTGFARSALGFRGQPEHRQRTTAGVSAESNANADVVGNGSANASTDASGEVLGSNGQPIGSAATSADGTLDGQGSIDLNSGVNVVKSKTLKAVAAEAVPPPT
jgi:hypothetical protein